MRGTTIVCLAGMVMLSAAAWAQIPDGFPGLSLNNLKRTTTVHDKDGKLQPEFGGVDDQAALELFAFPNRLSGSKLTNRCESRYDDGKGEILYSLSGGATSGKGVCEGESFEWTAQSTASGGRLVLNGRGIATHGDGERIELIQQMTVRVTGNKCTLEAYSEKVTRQTVHPYLKTVTTWNDETIPARGTTCSVE
jgi:hypothetical protein